MCLWRRRHHQDLINQSEAEYGSIVLGWFLPLPCTMSCSPCSKQPDSAQASSNPSPGEIKNKLLGVSKMDSCIPLFQRDVLCQTSF
ncbi:hypothetical protein ATANTOWER_022197 [Ataeniobius toweri]|uniref:Uncharacterized protein n=1 Tax=Ataeniobius toweri TaxID=208326 RepID=A0ABU7CC58_9TELE|nr:hypothetical protein [Ataeniobius toweri]